MTIAHVLQECRRLAASCAGMAIDIQHRIFIFSHNRDFVKLLQGNIAAPGNVTFQVFFRSTHIHENCAGRFRKFF